MTATANKVLQSENQDDTDGCSNIQKPEKADERAPIPSQSGIYNPACTLVTTTGENKVPPSENQDYTNGCSNIQKSEEYAPVPNQRALSVEGHDFVLKDHIPAPRRSRVPVGYLM
jgi:hypothetical protein